MAINDDLLEPNFDEPVEGYPPTEWDEVAPLGYQETGAGQLSGDEYLIQDDYTPQWEQDMQAPEEQFERVPDDETAEGDEAVNIQLKPELGSPGNPIEFTPEEMNTDFTQEAPAGVNLGEGLLEPDFGGVEQLDQAQQMQPEVDAVTGADGGMMPADEPPPPPPPGSQEALMAQPVTPESIRKTGLEGIRRQHEAEQLYANKYGMAVHDARIAEAQAFRAQEVANEKAMVELQKLSQEQAEIMKESPKSWWEGANTTQKIGAAVSAIFGGMLAGLNGGPNTGLDTILKIADDDMNRQIAGLQNRRSSLGEQRTLVGDRLSLSDNKFRTKQAYLLGTLGKIREELMSEMITLDPNGSLMQKYNEYLVQIAQQEAAIQRQVGMEAFERGHKQAQQAIEIKKAEMESADKAKQRALEYRGQNITQRGQDLQLIKDRFSVSDEVAKQLTVADYKNTIDNGWSGGYAIDKNGGRHLIRLTPGQESQKAVRDTVEGRNLLVKSLQNLDALAKSQGFEFWDQVQGEERARATAYIGKLLSQRQQTQQELELAGKMLGKPQGWFLGELRKDPGAMARMTREADRVVMEKVRQNLQPGYENMTVALDQRKLVPDATYGASPPPDLPGNLDKVNEFNITSNSPFSGKAGTGGVRADSVPWWAAESDKDRLVAIINIAQHNDATGGFGKLHLERGLFDSADVVRGVAASQLGKIGDPESVPWLDQVAESDKNEKVRGFARKAADQIRANPKFKGAFDEKTRELNILPPPSSGMGTGASAGGSYSGPTLTPDQAVEIINQTRVK